MIKMARKVLCLDWDKRSLRIVVGRVGGGRMTLEDAHSHRLPNTVDADEPQAMGDFIRQMLKRHRLRARHVLVDVPRERAVINRLTLPPTPDDEVAGAVRFQAMRELPFPLDTAAADYVVTGRDESGQTNEVLLAAVTKETLDRIRATCEVAGLTPARIGLRPYANLVSARHVMDLTGKRVLFVDVGPGATEIDVFHGDALAFARSANVNVPVPVPLGEKGAKEDSRIISLAEIADLESGDEAIQLAVDELLLEVTRTLTAYRATETDGTIDSVVVAGGTGIESQFAETMQQRLHYPVQTFDPTEPLNVDSAEATKLRSFSAALGLAWGLSREGLLALDFLNPKRAVSSRETLKKRARVIGLAAAMIIAVVGAGIGYKYTQLQRELDGLNSTNAELRKERKEKQIIKDQIDRVDEWRLAAVWPDELRRITDAAVEPGKKTLVQAIEMESNSRNHRITLRNVVTADFGVGNEFITALREIETDSKSHYSLNSPDWTEIDGGVKFKSRIDSLVLELPQLKQAQEEIAKLEKKRKRRR